jgi:hypothetical protein
MSDLSGSVSVSGSDVGGAIITLTAMASQVAKQPQFPAVTSKELQSLNPHLATAQGHSNDWIDNISGQLWDRLQGVVSFGEVFGNLEGGLVAAAKAMGDEKSFAPNEIAKLIAMLQALQSLVQQQHDQSVTDFNKLADYAKAVNSDFSAFETDFNTANRVLGGDQGEIAQLQAKISSENDAMSKDLAMIGGGAAMMVVGILVIACGALLEFETAGAATLIIAAGVAVVAGGAAMTGVAGKDYDDKLAQVAIDQQNLASDRAEIALLHGVNTQLTSLTTTLAKTQQALSNMVTGWEQLDNGITAVVQDLQNPQDYLASVQRTQPNATPATVALIVGAEIQTAAQDWANSVKIAQSYLDKGRNVVFVNTGSKPPTQDAIAAAAAETGHPAAQPRVHVALAGA